MNRFDKLRILSKNWLKMTNSKIDFAGLVNITSDWFFNFMSVSVKFMIDLSQIFQVLLF